MLLHCNTASEELCLNLFSELHRWKENDANDLFPCKWSEQWFDITASLSIFAKPNVCRVKFMYRRCISSEMQGLHFRSAWMSNCTTCSQCRHRTTYSWCRHCTACSQCRHCITCSQCRHCITCSHCRHCITCSQCRHCIAQSQSRHCTICSQCRHWREWAKCHKQLNKYTAHRSPSSWFNKNWGCEKTALQVTVITLTTVS